MRRRWWWRRRRDKGEKEEEEKEEEKRKSRLIKVSLSGSCNGPRCIGLSSKPLSMYYILPLSLCNVLEEREEKGEKEEDVKENGGKGSDE